MGFTLKQAREERLEAQKLLREGNDPLEVRKDLKARRQKKQKSEQLKQKLSFHKVAMEWWERQSGNLTGKHGNEIKRSLENHVFPKIGHMQITDIPPKAIKEILLGLESEGKAETVHRIHQRIRSVFQYAVIQEWTDRNPSIIHFLWGNHLVLFLWIPSSFDQSFYDGICNGRVR